MPFNKVISRVIYSFCGLIATSMQTWLELNAGSKLIKIQEYEDAQPEKPKFKIVEKKKEMLRTTSFAQG